MNELVMAAIPVIASVLGTTILSVACKSLIKKVVNKTIKNLGDENANLKKSLGRLNANLEDLKKQNEQKEKTTNETINLLIASNLKTKNEVEEIKNQNSKLDHVCTEVTIIKNSLRNEKLNKEK